MDDLSPRHDFSNLGLVIVRVGQSIHDVDNRTQMVRLSTDVNIVDPGLAFLILANKPLSAQALFYCRLY